RPSTWAICSNVGAPWYREPRAMVTETRTLEFERYYERSIPTALRSSETPDTWPHGAEAWAEHRQAALAYLRAKCEFDFCFQIAATGWRPHELASGRPDQ